MNVKIYIEGGGNNVEQRNRCREGFRKLIASAGFSPSIVACGGRGKAYDKFCTAIKEAKKGVYLILLVDSEEPISQPADSPKPWEHLQQHDHWERPPGVKDDQAQFMVTCMESWIMADHHALAVHYGAKLGTALLSVNGLEARTRFDVQDTLMRATRNCTNAYEKGKRSFRVLAELNPATLQQHLLYFKRFIEALRRYSGTI